MGELNAEGGAKCIEGGGGGQDIHKLAHRSLSVDFN